ncbi:MAG TPA: N-6 DNA methylase [Terriglobales bacterium]|nr:N-6 DNA methylase [Terriglobales bacterium]
MNSTLNRNLFETNGGSANYAPVYQSLADLREEFHRSGRLDDSNAKLDEVVKLFSTYLGAKLGDIDDFPKPTLSPEPNFVGRLQECFALAGRLPYYVRNDDISIFGSAPTLTLRESDSKLAARLVQLVTRAVDDAFLHQELGNPYDVLNEAFGHFIRDNFRGNIEDAQYLTPTEVVEMMATLAAEDLRRDGRLSDKSPLVVADPCCGVGSFLATFAARYRPLEARGAPHLKLFAQDKVERMVRLATVNLTLFRVFDHSVSIGNSLYKGSPLDVLNGQVDLVLTNPPFGARFTQAEIKLLAGDNTPFLSTLGRTRGPLESELLFVDRDLRLLRDGGLLLIVVPDSVVSSSGTPALLRHHLCNSATLRGVIELPSVTFAQAGTRTKTVVLYVKKGKPQGGSRHRVFMAVSEDLGFQVSSRKGVQIKAEKGKNDLFAVAAAYSKSHGCKNSVEAVILSEAPSAVVIPESHLGDSWTPGHYQARRLEVLRSLADTPEVLTAQLKDLVDFVAEERRLTHHRAGAVFISVLHVIAEGILDLGGISDYAPKTPGVPVECGEVLLSRINPRIPRVVVVPDLGRPVVCSTEFEVMRPRKGVDAYMIAYLLLSRPAQAQIQSLTSGTSASHNRVKPDDLARISLPIPRAGTESEKRLKEKVAQYHRVLARMAESSQTLLDLRRSDASWLKSQSSDR